MPKAGVLPKGLFKAFASSIFRRREVAGGARGRVESRVRTDGGVLKGARDSGGACFFLNPFLF